MLTPPPRGSTARTLPRPRLHNACRLITWKRFSLIRFRSPLLTESRLFSSPVGTEMFHFPTFPPHALCVQARVTPHDGCGVPPFGHPRINARLAAPRGFSQPPTSFIGSWCPGIHRAPLTTWPHGLQETRYRVTEDARVHCAVLNVRPVAPAPAPAGPAVNRGGTENPEDPGREGQRPTPRTGRPAPSGPNSAPTTPGQRPGSAPHPHAAGSTRSRRHAGGRTGQRSTLEHHPAHPPPARR